MDFELRRAREKLEKEQRERKEKARQKVERERKARQEALRQRDAIEAALRSRRLDAADAQLKVSPTPTLNHPDLVFVILLICNLMKFYVNPNFKYKEARGFFNTLPIRIILILFCYSCDYPPVRV